MPGNSRRRGAVRKPGSKKGPTVGSGGQRRQGLEGRGPTPKAEDRPYHPAGRRKASSERREDARDRAGSGHAPAAGPERSGGERSGGERSRNERSGGERSGGERSGGQRTGGQGRAPAPRRSGGSRSSAGGTELIAGRNAVVEALRAQIPATTVWMANRLDADDRTREILRVAAERDLELIEVGKPELDRLTDHAVHQGVAMAVPPYSYLVPEDMLDDALGRGHAPLFVALDGITDPRNLGAALRSAGAFGADGVIVPERRAAGVTASAWKVSAGAAARVPVARATNLVRTLQAYAEAGCFIVGLDAGGSVEIGDLELASEPLVIVCGSEGKGLGRLVRETCDVVASIPISASTESLNAGIAIGISLYEVSERRRGRRSVAEAAPGPPS